MGKDTQEQDMPGLKPRNKQEWIVEKNERDDVRKAPLLPENHLPLRYFNLRGSKDLRVGIYPFLKVPTLEGVGESDYPSA